MGAVGRGLDPTGGKFLGLNKIPVIGNAAQRAAAFFPSLGSSEWLRKDPFGLPINSPLGKLGLIAGQGSTIGGPDDPNIPGPFTLNQDQLNSDLAGISGLGKTASSDIAGLGQKQYDQTQGFIGEDAASRAAARAQLADVLTNQYKNTFARTLPDIAENSQARHLYDTTGYGQEVARQQGYGAQDIASQMGQLGAQDIYNQSAQRQAALQALQGTQSQALGVGQGYQQAGLGRQLSLEDFINEANVAKTIGAESAPQVGGKAGQAGGMLSGIGTGASAGGMIGGPWGAGIGAGLGALLGRTAYSGQRGK